MGNGCCNEDRHESDRLLANGTKLAFLVSIAKEVEAALPRLDKETNRTRQTIDYLKREVEAISAAMVDTENKRMVLITEVSDLHEGSKTLLMRKTLHYVIGSNADQVGFGSQVTRYGKEGLARKLLETSRAHDLLHKASESGEGYSRSLSDQLHLILDQNPENHQTEASKTLAELESKLIIIQKSVTHLQDLEDRIGKVSSQLSINLQSSLQNLATEVSNLLKPKQEYLQKGLANDVEIAEVGKVTKPSLLCEKVRELDKRLDEMQNELKAELTKTEFCTEEVSRNIKEIRQLEARTEEYITDISQISLPMTPVPVAEDDLPTQSEHPPAHIDGSMEDYYLGKIQEMRKILVTEDMKLKSALDKQSELDAILTARKEELYSFKIKMMIMILKLQHVRTRTRLIRLWKLETERTKWMKSIEIIRDSRVENERILTVRRKLDGLVRTLHVHWIWAQGRTVQIWKEAVLRRNQVHSFFPETPNPKVQRAKARSMATGLVLIKRRFQMYAFTVILRNVRRRKAAALCGYKLKRCLHTRLTEGWRRIQRANETRLSSEGSSLGEELSFDEKVNDERAHIAPMRSLSRMASVPFARVSQPS